jgi:large subunit ribosomal protein L25
MDAVINAAEREESAKKTRKKGCVPGNIYGPGINRNMKVRFEGKEINQFLRNHSIGAKTIVSINEKELPCVIKGIQYEPISNKPIHIELYATSEDKLVNVRVPVKFKGKAWLAQNNLVLQVLEDEIRIQGTLRSLPEFVSVDVAAMKDGNVVTVDNVSLPKNIRLLVKKDKVIARIDKAMKASQEDVSI